MRPVVACIHGISTGVPARYTYAGAWQEALARHDIEVDCRAVVWGSQGFVAGDLLGWAVNPTRIDDARREVEEQLNMLRPDAIIAHSAGAYLVDLVSPAARAVHIGSPLTHPAWGPWLRRRRRGSAKEDRTHRFASMSDPVSGLFGSFGRDAPVHEVVNTGSRGHAPESYFDNARVRELIKWAISTG